MHKLGPIMGSIRRLGSYGPAGQIKKYTYLGLGTKPAVLLKGVLRPFFAHCALTNGCEYGFYTLGQIFLSICT